MPKLWEVRIHITSQHKKTVEDIDIKKKVTEFHYCNCYCSSCQKDFTTSSKDLPKQGRFGPNICSLWSILHYKGTIPLERLSNISGNSLKIPITAGGLQNIIYRTAKIFEPDFAEIKGNVKKSKYARSDETSYSYNGKKYWLWNISTCNETLVLIRNSRGSKILKEVFGNFFDGILNSDCYSAYSKFKAREYQKCWAHVIRDAKDLAKNSKEGEELYKMLSNMYKSISEIKGKGRENTLPTKFWIWFWKRKIELWLHRNYESKAVRNLVLRMGKYKEQWFTCLKYSFVEATNNASERDIRKNVIARKISGLHRSKLGLHSREIMMSILLTRQRMKENSYDFVLNGIGKFNLSCG